MPFFNTSRFTFERLKGDPNHIAANLTNFIKGFSSRAREIIEHFGFEEHIAKLDKADRLFLVVSKFCEIDLHPDKVLNIEMGYIFEDLVRRFNATPVVIDAFSQRVPIVWSGQNLDNRVADGLDGTGRAGHDPNTN